MLAGLVGMAVDFERREPAGPTMKFYAARARDEIRRFCKIAKAATPQWSRILLAASLGALLLVYMVGHGRWGALSGLIGYYVAVNIVVAASATCFLGTKIYREYGLRRAMPGEDSP